MKACHVDHSPSFSFSHFLRPSWYLFLLTITLNLRKKDKLYSPESCTRWHDEERGSWDASLLTAGSAARGSRGFPWLPPLVQSLASHLSTRGLHSGTPLAKMCLIHPLTAASSLKNGWRRNARGTRDFKLEFLLRRSSPKDETSTRLLVIL